MAWRRLSMSIAHIVSSWRSTSPLVAVSAPEATSRCHQLLPRVLAATSCCVDERPHRSLRGIFESHKLHAAAQLLLRQDDND